MARMNCLSRLRCMAHCLKVSAIIVITFGCDSTEHVDPQLPPGVTMIKSLNALRNAVIDNQNKVYLELDRKQHGGVGGNLSSDQSRAEVAINRAFGSSGFFYWQGDPQYRIASTDNNKLYYSPKFILTLDSEEAITAIKTWKEAGEPETMMTTLTSAKLAIYNAAKPEDKDYFDAYIEKAIWDSLPEITITCGNDFLLKYVVEVPPPIFERDTFHDNPACVFNNAINDIECLRTHPNVSELHCDFDATTMISNEHGAYNSIRLKGYIEPSALGHDVFIENYNILE